MSWKDHYNAAKSAPSGVAVTVAHVPTSELGWKDHFQDLNNAAMDIRKHIGASLAGHLSDDPEHQKAIAGAISNALGK